MSDTDTDQRSPLEIAIDEGYEAEMNRIRGESTDEPPKPKRRRVDFHGLTVIDGGRKD